MFGIGGNSRARSSLREEMKKEFRVLLVSNRPCNTAVGFFFDLYIHPMVPVGMLYV